MSFYCFKQSFKSLYCIRRQLYFGVAYSSGGTKAVQTPVLLMLGLGHCSENGGIFQLALLKCLLKSHWRMKAVLTLLGRVFDLLALLMNRSVRYFHIFLLGIMRRECCGDVCLNTHPQMTVALIWPLIQLCSGSRKWTCCLKKVEVVLISCCHYSCEYLFRNFSPKIKNSIVNWLQR